MKLSTLIKTATLRQTLVTLLATGTNGVLAVFFYLGLARALGPAGYGVFTLVSTTIALLVTIFEFGADRGLVKFVSLHRDNLEAQRQVSKLIFIIKLISGTTVAVLSFLLAPQLAGWLFHRPELAGIIPIIGFGVFAQLLFFFSFYYMQAYEKFVWWGSLLVGSNFLRLVLAVVLIIGGGLTAVSASALYAFVPLFGFFLGLTAIDRRLFSVSGSLTQARELFGFNKWVTGFTTVSAVNSRLDTYLTARLVDLSAVGVYGLGTQAVNFLPQIIVALGAVTAPKFARFDSAVSNRTYIRKTTLLSLGIAFLVALVMIPGGWLLFAFSGRQYIAGFWPYLLLLCSQLLFLVSSPLRDSLLYYFNRPQFFFWAGLGHGLITAGAALALIPRLGLMGAALSNFSGQLFLSLASISLYLRLQTKD